LVFSPQHLKLVHTTMTTPLWSLEGHLVGFSWQRLHLNTSNPDSSFFRSISSFSAAALPCSSQYVLCNLSSLRPELSPLKRPLFSCWKSVT
ncbi:unnamed protein product, partial [Brassica napus]